ncbi:hypothetical protein KKKH12_11640 [Helicobacter pylori]
MHFLKNTAVLIKFQYIKDSNFTFKGARRAINPIKGFTKMVRKIIEWYPKEAFLKTLL